MIMECLKKIQRGKWRISLSNTASRKDSAGDAIWIKKEAPGVDMMSNVKRVNTKEEEQQKKYQVLIGQDRKQ